MFRYTKPDSDEYSSYFGTYLEHLAGDNRDVLAILREQGLVVSRGLKGLGEKEGNYSYEAGKWTVKDLLGHLIDTERLFAFRALWIARGESNIQPGMDENLWAANSNAGQRSLKELCQEYDAARTNHLHLFQGFDETARARRNKSKDAVPTVNAIVWISAAHELHHLKVLRDRYGMDFLTPNGATDQDQA